MSDAQDGWIKLTIDEARGLAKEASRQTVRFVALANAGGVIATVTVLGAAAKEGVILNILALPLGFFAAGLICALLVTVHFVFTFRSIATGVSAVDVPRFRWVGLLVDQLINWAAVFQIVFFVIGCIASVLIVAFA